MALIIFPAVGYDSYVTVADATTIIDKYTVNGAEWAAVSPADQEIYLRIAFRRILDGIEDLSATPLPDPILGCEPESQSLMAVHDVVNGISATAGSAGAAAGEIKMQQVGTLKVEYFQSDSGFVATTTNPIPSMVRDCLEKLNYVFSSTSNKFKQQRLGRM